MLATVSLGSCNLAKNQLTYDRGTNQDMQDYRDGLSPEHHPAGEAASNAAPEFQSVVSTPADLRLPSPLVTVSVNQTVSLHDLMFELAEQAGVDLEMDPNIHGSIIFTAKDRPFNDVVDRIAAMAGLRYTFENNVLRIELDRPYLKTYKVDFMSTGRKNVSSITTGISSSNSGSAAGATSSKNGSDAKVDNTNDSDFWKDIDAGLKQVLAASDTYTTLASQDEPVAVAEPPPPPPLGPDGKPLANAPPSTLPPTLNVSTVPSAPPVKSAPSTYAISKETGVVSVFASDRQQRLVQKFFDNYRRQALTQVLIEAKVLEVDLSDQYAAGIDWGTLSANLTRLVSSGTASFPAPVPAVSATPTGAFTLNLDLGHGFKPVISALSQFGTVRALSSPRVTVMNNQSAVVNVATNLVYFNITATTTPGTTTGTAAVTSFTSTQQSVPEGVLLNVTPTVNPDTGEIILAVRPTVSKFDQNVVDPSIDLNIASAAVASGQSAATAIAALPSNLGAVPQMSVQEIDSIIKMQSGQTMVMGGLMKDGNTVAQQGIPILGDLPGIGALFRGHSDDVEKQELVIFLKATVIPGSNLQDMDRKVYKQFGNDTRPFPM